MHQTRKKHSNKSAFFHFIGFRDPYTHRTKHKSAKRICAWVRNIAPPLPCRKPCKMGQIPVQKAEDVKPSAFLSYFDLFAAIHYLQKLST